MNAGQGTDWLGSATISPTTLVVAGDYGTWTIEYTVGRSAIDDGGRIRIAYRTVSDHGTPQFDRPDAEGFVSVWTSGIATLAPVFETAGVRPWSKTITLRVREGQLAEGDRVTIVLGDTAYGSPGIRAETYPERDFTFKVLVDPLDRKSVV